MAAMSTVTETDLSTRIAAARAKAAIPAYERTVPREQVDVEAFNHVGDPIAEAVVPELREHGLGRDPITGARRLAAAGVPAAVAFLGDVEHVPAWADFEAMRAGASLGRRVPLALALGIHGALPLA